jgi:hypothetical protein
VSDPRRAARRKAQEAVKKSTPPASRDYAEILDDQDAHHALMDMTLGTDDPALDRIRAEHALCDSLDCPHLRAFYRYEDRLAAMGRSWRLDPAPRHQR